MAVSREDVLSYLEESNMVEISELIAEIEEKFGAVLTYSRLEAEKKISGKLFRYDSNEAKDIHNALTRRVKKNSVIEI